MDTTVPYPELNWESDNLKEAWTRFKSHANLMFDGPLSGKSEKIKCAYLLIWLGEKGRDVFSTWTLATDEKDKICVYLAKFDDYFNPQSNPIFSRYTFHKRDQREGETIEQYATELKILVRDCSYGATIVDEMVRDRLIFGTSSQKIRERLLQSGSELTLSDAIKVARTYTETQVQLKTMSAESTSHGKQEVDIIKKNQNRLWKPNRDRIENRECYFCGGDYSQNHQCPAKGKICSNCRKPNHFARVCRGSKKTVNIISSEAQQTDELFIHQLMMDKADDQPYAKLRIANQFSVKFKIDTGAQASIITRQTVERLNPEPAIHPTNHILTSFCGQTIPVLGTCKIDCAYKSNDSQPIEFFVVQSAPTPILGFSASRKLNLIKLILSLQYGQLSTDKILTEFSDLFEGVGKLEGECKIILKEGAQPSIQPTRRIPLSLQSKFKEELDRMENLGVIEKVTHPTDWVNSAVVVEKPDGTLRVCIDPHDLNKAIKRPHHPMPTFEEAVQKHVGAKYFSKLDARTGYWNLCLDDESSELTTFSTPYGRYKFRRMPFGLKSAQDEFQRHMEEAFSNLKRFSVISDDMIISGVSEEDHDRNLQKTLLRAREKGVKLNKDKCIFKSASIPYFGHIISENGIHPDPEKIRAIEKMPSPKSQEELQTALGMLNYLSRYIPNLSSLNEPLRTLAKQKQFNWTNEHEATLTKIKASIITTISLFDPTKNQIEIQVDASKSGLGAVLLQENKIVSFASKSLNETEQRYSQIEKELYAIVFGCRHFHQYLYGRHFQVISDHKPLETILNRPINKSSPRLQRMLLHLQPYDFSITYRPGTEIPIPDTLSRLHLETEEPLLHREIEYYVHSVMKLLPISQEKLSELKQETLRDPQLRVLRKMVEEGWPEKRSMVPSSIAEFWTVKSNLSVVDDIIMKDDRLVIPDSMQIAVLQSIHASHLGIEKTKNRARSVIFWPKMSQTIEDFVKKCDACCTYSTANAREPLLHHDIPSYPWEHVGIDLFYISGRYYLIIVDYYSRFFEADELGINTYTNLIIQKLKSHFSRFGIPLMITSDNGPQFTSETFKDFMRQWGIRHNTSSPNHPQSNGLAEKTVGIAKAMIMKTKKSKTDLELALLEYRNTPVDGLASPAQLLMSRNLRSLVPCTIEHLSPKVVPMQEFMSARNKERERQRRYYDQHTKSLNPLQIGQQVRVRSNDQTWQPATVLREADAPRSYVVQTKANRQYRRNRKHLKVVTTDEKSSDSDSNTGSSSVHDSWHHSPDLPQTEDVHFRQASMPELPVAVGQENTVVSLPSAAEVDNSLRSSVTTRSGRQVKPPSRINL